MRLFPSDKTYPSGVDAWGFPTAWVPFGKAGEVQFPNCVKNITYDELFIQESLDTLPGKPVYYFHPGAVTPDNFDKFPIVGITTDIYRVSKDGLGGEVLVRITKPEIYQAIVEEAITESSPGYGEPLGYRDYNHIAIVPPGYARGGDKMKIELESSTPIYEVYTGLEPVNLNPTLKPMDTQLGELAAQNQLILQELGDIRTMLVADTAEDAADSVTLEAAEIEKKFYQEGYEQGITDGRILVEAKAHGYEGDSPSEAKTFVVAKAFPSINLEAKSPEFLDGLYSGALTSLSRKESSPTAPVTTPPTVTIVQESKDKKVVNRLPNGQK
jgi:hypothetical protein